jgi:hypothetical protein
MADPVVSVPGAVGGVGAGASSPPPGRGGGRDGRLSALLEQLRKSASQAQQAARALLGETARAAVAREDGGSAAVAARHLVYVHGICKHPAGYSNDWWNALHPYTTAFGAGVLGDTRQEVLWSDIVEGRGAALRAAPGAPEAPAEWAARVRGVLEDRAATHALETGPAVTSPELARALLSPALQPRGVVARDLSLSANLTIPGLGCVEDFTVYMFDDSVRAQIIGRFTDVVRPLLEQGDELDVISHSWGTVVAYEGLRELEDSGLTAGVRNFFTAGAALSIYLVKLRLRPANRDGHRPALVRRWINLNAHGDPVGGRLQGQPFQVDAEFLDLPNLGCGPLDASCAHGSYFQAGNVTVNRDVFAAFINSP